MRGHLPITAFVEPTVGRSTTYCTRRNGALLPGVAWDPLSLASGRRGRCLAAIDDAVRMSSSPNRLELSQPLPTVVFDEHGGTYDHVPSPSVPVPTRRRRGPGAVTFTRAGARARDLGDSPWIPARTVVNDTYRHMSVIRTVRERWSLGCR